MKCDDHDHQTEVIEKNTAAISTMSGGVSALKWVVGIGLTIALFIIGIGMTQATGKLNEITGELKSINTAVHSIALDQVAAKTEMKNLEERLCKLEKRGE